MRNKILFINKIQFGYHSDAYMYAKYLKQNYDIISLSLDLNRKRVSMDGVKNVYIPSFSRYQGRFFSIVRNIVFYVIVLYYILTTKSLVFAFYFKGAEHLKRLLPFKRMILCVCTLSVTNDEDFNRASDDRLRKTANMYDMVVILSEGMRRRLNLDHENVHIMPLGAEIISKKEKDFSKFELLYVGTITNRDVDKTIRGLRQFIDSNPTIDINYHIVGDGNTPIELQNLKDLVKELNLNKYVHLYGRIPNTELQPFFDNCNYGISFVPITDYFDNQPVTKTFEYAMSGLFVLGTATKQNLKVIEEGVNGFLIKDSSTEFMKSLKYIRDNYKNIDENRIRQSLTFYKWENLVNNVLSPIISKFF